MHRAKKLIFLASVLLASTAGALDNAAVHDWLAKENEALGRFRSCLISIIEENSDQADLAACLDTSMELVGNSLAENLLRQLEIKLSMLIDSKIAEQKTELMNFFNQNVALLVKRSPLVSVNYTEYFIAQNNYLQLQKVDKRFKGKAPSAKDSAQSKDPDEIAALQKYQQIVGGKNPEHFTTLLVLPDLTGDARNNGVKARIADSKQWQEEYGKAVRENGAFQLTLLKCEMAESKEFLELVPFIEPRQGPLLFKKKKGVSDAQYQEALANFAKTDLAGRLDRFAQKWAPKENGQDNQQADGKKIIRFTPAQFIAVCGMITAASSAAILLIVNIHDYWKKKKHAKLAANNTLNQAVPEKSLAEVKQGENFFKNK